MLQQPRELVERRNTASRVFEHLGLRRVHGAQRFPRADLPMQLFQCQERAEVLWHRRRAHLPKPESLGGACPVAPAPVLCARTGDALRRLLGELHFAFEIGQEMRPVVLFGAHAREGIDGGPIARVRRDRGLVRRHRLGSIIEVLFVHLSEQERGPRTDPSGARVAKLELQHVDQLFPIASFTQLPRQLLEGGRVRRIDFDRLAVIAKRVLIASEAVTRDLGHFLQQGDPPALAGVSLSSWP